MSIGTPAPLRRLLERLEGAEALDAPAQALEGVAARVAPTARIQRLLQGDGVGHALHPLLTDFPLGMWMSANYVDVLGGRRGRPVATGLLASGLLAAVPTIATGLAEWRTTRGGARRVGVAHAMTNGMGFALYALSLVLRLRRRHGAAVGVGLLAGATVTAGGYLGGHLSLVHKVGSADPGLMPPGAATAAPGTGPSAGPPA